jgi:hypothetical protein
MAQGQWDYQLFMSHVLRQIVNNKIFQIKALVVYFACTDFWMKPRQNDIQIVQQHSIGT